MLRECMEVFKDMLEEHGERLILDTYVPADGTYILVDKNGNCRMPVEIQKDAKTKQIERTSPFLPDICFYDYYSQLISMNKPMDPKKIIHSNNYLSLWIKKDSLTEKKLTEDIIDTYFSILKNPKEKKYAKSKEAVQIYEEFAEAEGEPDLEKIEKIQEWVKQNINQLANVDMSKNNYLKIFFEAEYSEYEREGKRYFLPNIYNSNDYNIVIDGKTYGIPNDNMGMNSKKPLLSFKSRKYAAPYVLDGGDAMLQKKFFDYLMNAVSAGKYHIYIDTEKRKIQACGNDKLPDEIITGYYLRIRKGKTEPEICDMNNISEFRQKLDKPFDFENILERDHDKNKHPEYEKRYGRYYKRLEMEGVISEVLFSNRLQGSYTGDVSVTDEKMKKNILLYRELIFKWIHLGIDNGIGNALKKMSLELIQESLMKGYRERALWQFNFKWSLEKYFLGEGEVSMGETISQLKEKIERKVLGEELTPIENDREYYYAVGQLVGYLLSLSKAKEKNHSLLKPFFNAKTDAIIKRRLMQLYEKYGYAISIKNRRAGHLLAMVLGYEPTGKADAEMITLGFACDSVIYTKEENKNE